MFWGGFNMHAADILGMLANLTLTETADAIYLPFGIMSGVSMFCWGMILDRFNVQ